MKDDINQTVKDYKYFLDHMEKLALPMSKEQRVSLNKILKTQLTLLVMLKKGSNLGDFTL